MANAPDELERIAVELTEEIGELLQLDLKATYCGYNKEGEVLVDVESMSRSRLKGRVLFTQDGQRRVTFWDAEAQELPPELLQPVPTRDRRH